MHKHQKKRGRREGGREGGRERGLDLGAMYNCRNIDFLTTTTCDVYIHTVYVQNNYTITHYIVYILLLKQIIEQSENESEDGKKEIQTFHMCVSI